MTYLVLPEIVAEGSFHGSVRRRFGPTGRAAECFVAPVVVIFRLKGHASPVFMVCEAGFYSEVKAVTIQVELNPELGARLAAQARAQGLPIEEAVANILEEAIAARSLASRDFTVGDFRAMLASIAEGSERLPNLATEEFTRASFYEDRT